MCRVVLPYIVFMLLCFTVLFIAVLFYLMLCSFSFVVLLLWVVVALCCWRLYCCFCCCCCCVAFFFLCCFSFSVYFCASMSYPCSALCLCCFCLVVVFAVVLCSCVARALIWGGGGWILTFSCYARLISFEIRLIVGHNTKI